MMAIFSKIFGTKDDGKSLDSGGDKEEGRCIVRGESKMLSLAHKSFAVLDIVEWELCGTEHLTYRWSRHEALFDRQKMLLRVGVKMKEPLEGLNISLIEGKLEVQVGTKELLKSVPILVEMHDIESFPPYAYYLKKKIEPSSTLYGFLFDLNCKFHGDYVG
jgi:hypothetical protein